MPKDILRRIVLPVAAEIFNNSNFQKYNQTFFLRKIPANSKSVHRRFPEGTASHRGTKRMIVLTIKSHPA